jgi:cation:H+ antiporter
MIRIAGIVACFALVGVSAAGSSVDLFWAAPAIIFAAFLIAWGAEAAQFMVSQGLALAILAWLQTLPEFAVEATLAWDAARGLKPTSYVTANFTGSIRLLMGFGMPVVYFIYYLARRDKSRRSIDLDPFHSVEVVSLFTPTLYFFFIVYRGKLDLLDSVILLGLYGMYLALLLRMPPEEEGESVEELPAVARAVLRRGKIGRWAGITAIFVLGGAVLYLCVHPFLDGLEVLAIAIGISPYAFMQWIAPFLSEFPEKVTAFNWARHTKKAKLGLMNFCSSNINQMTMLVAMIPIVYGISQWTMAGRPEGAPIRWGIEFDAHQKSEVLLTACQAALCMVLLFNMKFEWWDAVGMFVLFIAQFLSPLWAPWVGLDSDRVRHGIVFVYLAWIVIEILLAMFSVRKWSFPLRLTKESVRRSTTRRHTAPPA